VQAVKVSEPLTVVTVIECNALKG